MFERFTERARQVIVHAQEEARTIGHAYIGTEHLLLGLLGVREGVAAQALDSLGVEIEPARREVLRLVQPGEEVRSGQIPFTPRAKKILEVALREALSLGHNHIGTEHLLLGLVRESEGVASQVLAALGAAPEAIRAEVIKRLEVSREEAYEAGPMDQDRSWLDFDPAVAFDLAARLGDLARKITFEVRRHDGGPPTYRVSCRLRGHENALRLLVALEDHGYRAVLDGDGGVRFGHMEAPSDGTARTT